MKSQPLKAVARIKSIPSTSTAQIRLTSFRMLMIHSSIRFRAHIHSRLTNSVMIAKEEFLSLKKITTHSWTELKTITQISLEKSRASATIRWKKSKTTVLNALPSSSLIIPPKLHRPARITKNRLPPSRMIIQSSSLSSKAIMQITLKFSKTAMLLSSLSFRTITTHSFLQSNRIIQAR